MIAAQKAISLDFSNMRGGMVSNLPALSIRGDETASGLNAIFRGVSGFERCPGFSGLKSTAMYSYYLRGIHLHDSLTGTETLLSSDSAGIIGAVNTGTGAVTTLYDGTGTGESWFANAFGKTFVTNGTDVVMVESATVAYLCGIAAPSGATAVASAGGSLAAGVYKIYVSYARKVDGANVLYSAGQSIGDVTLSGGNGTITFTITNSGDTKVNNKVVWMTNAAGTVYYYYGETGNNTSTTLAISATTNRNTSLIYSVEAQYNQRPGALNNLHFCAGRLWGAINNVLYYSMRSGTQYDLERWPSSNYNTYPFPILSMFTLGEHLYLNTTGGILRQPFGDPAQQYSVVDSRWYFKFPRTIDYWGNAVVGLTNDGVRYFDGEKFAQIDLSLNIRPEIDKAYAGYTTTIMPAGKVVRRSYRTEYQLSYIDVDVTTLMNNRTVVLNLDETVLGIGDQGNFPWEKWENGFGYAVQDKDRTIFKGQTINNGSNGAGHVYKEISTSNADTNLFNPASTFAGGTTAKQVLVRTRQVMPDIDGFCLWQKVRLLMQLGYQASLRIVIADRSWSEETQTITTGDETTALPLADVAIADIAVLPIAGEYVISRLEKLSRKMKGKSVYIEISQTADDINFKMLSCVLYGVLQKTRGS